ncbi:hypothetical protein MKX42_06065 [Paenibacillus sp. FSL R7-0204]|uniref:hypothetical protein n=1 Tax=unclassified Paenibacillus TaxID=185978 RepID=UPI0030F8ECAD
MKLKDLIRKHYGVFCPNCGYELSIYTTFSIKKFALKCNKCDKGYMYEREFNRLTPSSVPDDIEKAFDWDEYNKYYKGIPTSVSFMPKILRKHFKN